MSYTPIIDALRDYECSLRPGESKVFKAAYEKARAKDGILASLYLGRLAVERYREEVLAKKRKV